jgi:SOS response regulatory protein OraA/RecX
MQNIRSQLEEKGVNPNKIPDILNKVRVEQEQKIIQEMRNDFKALKEEKRETNAVTELFG